MVSCEVRLFGPQARLQDAVMVRVEIEAGVTRCDEVLALLSAGCPLLAPSIAASRLAVDHAIADPARVLWGTEELALIGMVSGG